MKRRSFLPPALFLLCSLLVIAAAAAGGDASDPLVSLSRLQGAFSQTVESRLDSALTASDAALKAHAGSGTPSDTVTSVAADTWTERRLKNGDTLSGGTGLNVLLLAGEAKVSFPSGAVVDVTEGKEVPSGTALAKDHRYLVAEDTVATVTVSSRTAVLDDLGLGTFTLSDSVDYNAMASALKTMHLFRGSFTGFGQGFDLETCCGKQVTRYTYTVTNYPEIPQGVQANLYLWGDQIIGGDVIFTGQGGFQTDLAFPKT